MGIPDGSLNHNTDQSAIGTKAYKRSGGGMKRSASELENNSDDRGNRSSRTSKNDDDSSSSDSSSDDEDQPYRLLPFHGEHRRAVSSVAFSPAKFTSSLPSYSSSSPISSSSSTTSYALCASASADGTVKIWDIRQSLFDEATMDPNTVSSSGMQSVNLNSHLNHIASSSSSNGATQQGANETSAPNNNITPNASSTAAVPSSQSPSAQKEVPEGGIDSTPRSKCLSAVSTLCGHSRGINDVAWSPRTGEVIATASDDKTLRLWDVTRASCGGGDGDGSGGLAGAPSSGTGSADSTTGNHNNGNGNSNSNSINNGMHNSTNTGNSTSGNTSVSTGTSPDSLVEFKGHSNFCFSVKFSPQGNLLVSGSFDETVKVWDVRSGECISTLPAHSDPVTGVDFNRDGTCIVSSSHDGLVRVWDVATGECLKTIYAEGNPPVSFVRYSPNGKYVLSGMLDGKLRLWNVTGKFANGGSHITSGIKGIDTTDAIGILGRGGVAVGSDSTGTGTRCTKTYAGGHVNAKYCIFSDFAVSNPRRPSIVTGSEDGKIYLYDLQTRNVRQVLEGGHIEGDAVLAVAAHGSKELLASGGMSNDRTVRFWAPTPVFSGRLTTAGGSGGEVVPMEQ